MKILAVDDDNNQLRALMCSIDACAEGCETAAFQDPVAALLWAETNLPDIAFLDMEMPGMNGIELAEKLKELNPYINLIFVTAHYAEYILDAVPLRFSGYIQKPADKNAIAAELQELRYAPSAHKREKLLTVKCFGEFEVFANGVPVSFAKKKTKEFLAYLIDRKGARVNGNTVCATIYEDNDNLASCKSGLRKCVADLRASLKAVGAEAVFIKGFDSYAVDVSLLKCDYYAWENAEPYALRAFRGEYMSQYSWAENTLSGMVFQLSQSASFRT